jgi:hypothetical protein
MVTLSLRLINSAPCHEDMWGSGGIASFSFASPLDGGEWSVSRPVRFTPGESYPSIHCIGGWVGLTEVLDATATVTAAQTIQSVPGGKVNILGGHSIGHSKQEIVYMYMCPIPNGFSDRDISLYSSKITYCF